MAGVRMDASITAVHARVFQVPTDAPEGDGTLTWDKTTLVHASVASGAAWGTGYSYAPAAAAALIADALADQLLGRDVFDIPAAWMALQRSVRNMGRAGVAATAIAALDVALWDLKARLLGVPLCTLLGRARNAVPIYGSGGFTTYDDARLTAQLSHWVEEDGCRWVKMKIGAQPERDPHRVSVARRAAGAAGLLVDANGAYTVKQALALAEVFDAERVSWFEEPVSSDDLAGLALLRQRLPAAIEVAAGEYAYHPQDCRRMLEAGAVDVLQADASRCLGITGFMQAAALAQAFHIPFSAHCAPALHLHPACAVPGLRHLEWFHDHVRIEHMLFDGAPQPRDGLIEPDLGHPGHGLELREADARRYEIH